MSTARPNVLVRLRKWFLKLRTPTQVLLRVWAIIGISVVVSFGAAWFGSWGIEASQVFVGMLTGFMLSYLVEMHLRVKNIERLVREQAVKEIVAQLADGRTIWIKDDHHTYEAPPPQKEKAQWN